MAIRAIWVFDHLPTAAKVGVKATGYGIAYSGYGIETPDQDAYTDMNIDRGAVSINNAAGRPANPRARFPLTNVTDGVSRKTHVAFTIVRRDAAVTVTTGALVTLGTATPLVLDADFPATINVEVPVRITVDRIAKTIAVYVNNKAKRIIRDASLVDSFKGGTFIYLGYSAGVLSAYCKTHFKDFIFVDDTQDSTYCDGPVNPKTMIMPLLSANAPGWTYGATSLLTSLSTAMTATANLAIPVVGSSGGPESLDLKVNTATLPAGDIVGVAVISSMQKVSPAAGVQPAAKIGPATVLKATRFPADTLMNYHLNFGLYQKAPGDLSWTKALLDSTTFQSFPLPNA